MGRVKTFQNNGSFLPSDINLIQDDYENGFAHYRRVLVAGMTIPGGTVAGTYYVPLFGNPGGALATTSSVDRSVMYFDPATWPSGTRALKMRLRTVAYVNGTAPAANFTVSLRHATAFVGAAAGVQTSADVVDASVTYTGLAANVVDSVQTSADFTVAGARDLLMTVVTSATLASPSAVSFNIFAEARLV